MKRGRLTVADCNPRRERRRIIQRADLDDHRSIILAAGRNLRAADRAEISRHCIFQIAACELGRRPGGPRKPVSWYQQEVLRCAARDMLARAAMTLPLDQGSRGQGVTHGTAIASAGRG